METKKMPGISRKRKSSTLELLALLVKFLNLLIVFFRLETVKDLLATLLKLM